MKPMLKALGTVRSNLTYDELLSRFSFNFIMCHYTVVAAMHHHPQSEMVQHAACASLRAMTDGNAVNQTRAGNAVRTVVRVVRAVGLVVVAMRAHPQSEEVQGAACAALRAMVHGDVGKRTRAVNEGAVEAVVAAMRRHPQSEGVQSNACATLNGMINDGNSDYQFHAGNCRAVEAVVGAMRAHPQSEEVQGAACAALTSMTRGNTGNQTRAVNAGAAGAANTAMTTHAASANVHSQATAVLQMLR
jgi:hypothetical protein